jgi:putative transposase
MPEDKTQWYGSRLVVAPHFYPSTKTCSACGHVKGEMPLDERVFRCEACGLVTDRDLHAARNLASLAGEGPPRTEGPRPSAVAGSSPGDAKRL